MWLSYEKIFPPVFNSSCDSRSSIYRRRKIAIPAGSQETQKDTLMFSTPIHPAIAHFPIVLLLIGAPLSILAVFFRKRYLPRLSAIVLLLGAVGAIAATVTGENDAKKAKVGASIIEEHEEWGELARNCGLAAALLAFASLTFSKHPTSERMAAIVASVAAIATATAVTLAGHYGGVAVYNYGVGINAPIHVTSPKGVSPETQKKDDARKSRKCDDDD